MKKTALALAALLILPSGAMAAQSASKSKAKPAPACTQTTTNLDCATTGTVERPNTAVSAGKPKVGIDVNPWIMPSAF
ncbi:hypothetical protein ASD64_16475 [Mesorhizobium sp. Root157]|uniref:hypothetical protein n=1 Tax=Mesorhizobium sp. Root157 TaxID=1736477 RepID=UPI0006F629E5|nr:hypothetical protein [Mesorhizobium sp. Root157]KQZ97857.1 hypothetical protein ASD64_16475 [Mesorhizobium sp. Root157]